MKRTYKTIIYALLVIVLVSSTAVGTVSPGQGLTGSQKEVLSRVDTFAGNGRFTLEDGSPFSASFSSPYSVATLPDGSLVVSDSMNQRIRQIKDGQVKTYAGITFEDDIYGNPLGGWSDGSSNLAVFSNPSGLIADRRGNVYVADAGNNSIRVISSNGQVTTVAGDGLIGHQDGAGKNSRFYNPLDVAVAKDGTLYVADTLNHLIRKITTEGEVSTLNAVSQRAVEVMDGLVELAGDYLDGNLQEAKFNEPSGLALDSKGNLYVSDSGNQLLRYIDFEANTVTTVAGNIQKSVSSSQTNVMYAEGGFSDGAALESSFNFPKGLAVTEEGGLLIADSLNHRIRYLLNGCVTTLIGDSRGRYGNADGINGYNQIHNPTDVLVLEDGSIIVADSYNNLIRKFTLYQLPKDLPQDKQNKIVKDSNVVVLDTLTKIVDGRMMVPILTYGKEMGYSVEIPDGEKIINVINGDVTIEFTIDDTKIIIQKGTSKTEKTIEIAPFIDESVIYLPLRALSEEMNLDVQWDHENQTVILREIGSEIEFKGKMEHPVESLREARVEDVVGIVELSRAGGVKKIRVFKGMALYHGDHITTEANSSLVFKVLDSEDEVTIGEKAQLYISDLRNISGIKKTRVFIWSGSVWIQASSLASSEDEFKIETPEGFMDIQGTTLLVGVDPETGESKFFIASGVGYVSKKDTDDSSGTTLFPSQQISIEGDMDEDFEDYRNIADLDSLIGNTSNAIIEAILKSKQAMDKENEEYLQNLMSQQQQDQNLNQAEIERINNNLENLIGNIVKSAIGQNKVSQDIIKKIIDEVNEQLIKKIDLNQVKPLQLSEQEKQKQAQIKLLEERRKQMMEQEKLKQEELKKQNEQLSNKLKEQLEKQKAAKQLAEEAAKKKAAEEYAKKLADNAARAAFEAKRKALEEERMRQNTVVAQPPISVPAPEPELPEVPEVPEVLEDQEEPEDQEDQEEPEGQEEPGDQEELGDQEEPGESDYPEWIKEPLERAINEANMNLGSVSISVDGSDIETSNKWVTEADRLDYEAVVSLALEEMQNGEATQTEINSAIEALEAAKTIFDTAKKSGTMESDISI
ncbi:stalk domain-containing protein [Tissierella sp.]|uniref:stalk domain-containing protein n=1 Tax=Tissierella sp. TaxID=41274 RepID=UPI002861AC23|nr:stalk domain-containing protein [Tissierella sp.]MDR7856684.1 stalk domain-containing protein [Tissierella sp.]